MFRIVLGLAIIAALTLIGSTQTASASHPKVTIDVRRIEGVAKRTAGGCPRGHHVFASMRGVEGKVFGPQQFYHEVIEVIGSVRSQGGRRISVL